MIMHKDIIVRLVFSFIFIAITFRVLGPIFFEFLKKKMPGQYNHENDIDSMIRKQRERLRAQYGLYGSDQSSQLDRHGNSDGVELNPKTKNSDESPGEDKKIFKEIQWGGGEFTKEIQSEITKKFSYTLADSKINAFLLLCERRKYITYLNSENKNFRSALKNYLTTLLLFFLLIEEIRENKYYILSKISKQIGITEYELALAFQIKILMAVAAKKEIKDERVFNDKIILMQYSEDTIKEARELVAAKEANLWAKSTSLFLEELNLALNYASILSPMPKLQNRKDINNACEILGVNLHQSSDEIKKIYKKIALTKHPDKIISQKLPVFLEKKAIEKFNKIQEAYEILIAHKK